ncbi:MAG: NAD-binding protein [Actinomycetales bacterium]|nr:NAD-binding protein [Actinomycetales bacterium]
MTQVEHVLVIGQDDVGRRACALLQESGARVTHLDEPTDSQLRTALATGIDGVAVLLHDDIKALRYSLVVHRMQPGTRLFVAMFDQTARAQLQRVVPDCVVLSPAAISMPSMVAAVIADQHARLRRIGLLGRLAGQLRPYDAGSGVLLGGILGLGLVIAIDTILGLTHGGLLRALYDATRTTATISSPELPDTTWHLAWATLAALAVMAFTAMFAAGLVNYLISGRHIALIGRRTAPRRGHVIIIGMGQVGLRLAQELRSMGIAVIGVEQHASARVLPIARNAGIPVMIGDGASRSLLTRVRVRQCHALVAAGSLERDNIAVAVSALALHPAVNVILRAGSDDAIEETRSLFHIGSVIDVNGLTAAFVTEVLSGRSPHPIAQAAPAVSRCQCSAGGSADR